MHRVAEARMLEMALFFITVLVMTNLTSCKVVKKVRCSIDLPPLGLPTTTTMDMHHNMLKDINSNITILITTINKIWQLIHRIHMVHYMDNLNRYLYTRLLIFTQVCVFYVF